MSMFVASTMNLATSDTTTTTNLMVPLLKPPQEIAAASSSPVSKGHLSPRSPLECDFADGHDDDKMTVSRVAASESGVSSSMESKGGKTVTFSPPLPPQQKKSTPESTATAKTLDTMFSDASQQLQSACLPPSEVQARAVEHVQRLLAPKEATANSDQTSKRKIRWAKRVKVKEIRHLNDIQANERDGLWMSLADQQMNKAMVRTTVTMMMRGETIPDDDLDFCTRGLEFRTKAGSKVRSRYKLRVRSAVLNEQDLQREEGFVDPDFIAMASMDESAECREAAFQRAEQDAKRVEKFLEEARLEFHAFRHQQQQR